MRKLNNRQLKYKKIFLEKLSNNVYTIEDNKCPCGGSRDFLISNKDNFGIPLRVVLCKRCGTMRVDPYYSEETLRSFYDLEYRKLYESNSRVSKEFFDREIETGRFIYKYLFNSYFKNEITDKTVFEIGCSAGGTLYYFRKMGNSVFGCDYDSTYVRYGKNKGLDLRVGGLEELEKLPEKADIIILCHVLEHFSNPVVAFKKIKKLLKNNGIIFVAVPGIYFIHKSSNADFQSYLQNAHAYYFTLKTLTEMADISGLNLVYGDESVFAIFDKNMRRTKHEMEDYRSELSYLKKISKYKYLVLSKERLENYLINILVKMKLLDFLVEKYHTVKKFIYS
jgi:SAM-dependent methyltransferase